MDQHKWSSERCLAWQRYNKLPQTEKDKEESWTECLEYAQRMRLSRRTDVDGTLADDRGASPLVAKGMIFHYNPMIYGIPLNQH